MSDRAEKYTWDRRIHIGADEYIGGGAYMGAEEYTSLSPRFNHFQYHLHRNHGTP